VIWNIFRYLDISLDIICEPEKRKHRDGRTDRHYRSKCRAWLRCAAKRHVMLVMVVCTAKFRREFGWACRTGCSPRLDQHQMSMPISQWRTRDKMMDTAATTPRRQRRRLLFRFSEVMRHEDAPASPAAATDGINAPTNDVIDWVWPVYTAAYKEFLGVLKNSLYKLQSKLETVRRIIGSSSFHDVSFFYSASALLAMQTAVIARAIVPVCLSVCPSVTFRCFVQTNEAMIVRFSACGFQHQVGK